MTYFITGFLACYLLCAILLVIGDGDSEYLNTFLFGPACVVFVALAVPFVWIWHFARAAVRGVSRARWKNFRTTNYHVVGPIYLCHDKNALKSWNKFFLVRVKKS